jgi:hypothetical protein
MSNTVDAYREAKMTYLRLRDQAKKDLLAQFNQLANQLFQIQKELRDDFGHKVSVPTKPKSSARKKVPVAVERSEPPKSSAKISAIEKKLSLQRKKLDENAKAGKPVQLIKDRIYELEDELRLARNE